MEKVHEQDETLPLAPSCFVFFAALNLHLCLTD